MDASGVPSLGAFYRRDGPDEATNPYHPDVLRAAVRELLILDRTVDARTLALPLMTARFRDRCATEISSEMLWLVRSICDM